ncbi:hypothetical protein [Roseovarius salis]|uniref:hypothetical protein n=1 Tax=Roseovarius salis TaxID=3376063 RepID=UPI0037C7406B
MARARIAPKVNPHLPHNAAELASPAPPDAADDETARRNADRLVLELMRDHGSVPHHQHVMPPGSDAGAGSAGGADEKERAAGKVQTPPPTSLTPVPIRRVPLQQRRERPLHRRRAPTRALCAPEEERETTEPDLRAVLATGAGARGRAVPRSFRHPWPLAGGALGLGALAWGVGVPLPAVALCLSLLVLGVLQWQQGAPARRDTSGHRLLPRRRGRSAQTVHAGAPAPRPR